MENKEHIENLQGEEAVSKLKELIREESVCHFVSNLSGRPLHSRPMSAMQVDDKGHIWFFSPRSSEKNRDIALDQEVQLFFSNTPDAEFLSVYGHARIVNNREKVEELWRPLVKAWFPEGPDDPELTLIEVLPGQAYYWDTRSNKAIAMLKILAAVVTGVVADDSVQGEISV